MPRWWVFPPRSPIGLFYRRCQDKTVHYIVRAWQGTDPGLDRSTWDPINPERTTWVSFTEGVPPVPDRRWRDLGGRVEELVAGEIRRRYRLLDCPPQAAAVGQNRVGEEVREHDGRRWIRVGDPAIRALGSWAGDEIAHQPSRALRFGSYQAWHDLAHRLVGQASLDDDELRRLAAVLVDPGRRPSFRPWTSDPEESHSLLLQGMRAAVARQDKDGRTPLDLARAALKGKERMVRLLLEAGARPGTGDDEAWPGERQ